jgi:hypothetical protein
VSEQPVKTKPPRPGAPKVARAVSVQVAQLAQKSGALDPEVIRQWPEIVGQELAALCRPASIRRRGKSDALVLRVPSGAAAMRVQFTQKAIIERAARLLRRPQLRHLIIEQTGALGATKATRWAAQRQRPPGDDANEMAAAPRPAADLQEALERLGRTIARRERPD